MAGFNNISSFRRKASPRSGLVRSTDGGDTWIQLGKVALDGEGVNAIAARGNVIVVAATGPDGGVWRSTDTGETFVRISADSAAAAGGIFGLPVGNAFDLVGDPGNSSRVFVAIDSQGVFESDDLGANWTAVDPTTTNNAASAFATQFSGSTNVKLAVHNSSAANQALYVGIVDNIDPCPNGSGHTTCAGDELVGLYRSDIHGATAGTWTPMPMPGTCEASRAAEDFRFTPCGTGGTSFHFGLQTTGQGTIHFSMVADPANKNVVYLGGDTQTAPNGGFGTNSIGATEYNGRLFRCTLGGAANCTTITDNGTNNNSAPHADSRAMAFDHAGKLFEVDDGGIYRQSHPSDATGIWQSMNGGHAANHLQITESYGCDYDHIGHVIVCSNQDNGVIAQIFPDDAQWKEIMSGDGGSVAVDDAGTTTSTRYNSSLKLVDLERRTCQANPRNSTVADTCNAATAVLLRNAGVDIRTTDFGIVNLAPITPNSQVSGWLVVGTSNQVWESNDMGATVSRIALLGDTTCNATATVSLAAAGCDLVRALAYGGMFSGTPAPNVLYVGADTGLYVRDDNGGATPSLAAVFTRHSTTYPGGAPIGIALDPRDWHRAYITDETEHDFRLGVGGDDVRFSSAFDRADVDRRFAEHGIAGERQLAQRRQ